MEKVCDPKQAEFQTLEKVRKQLQAMGLKEPKKPEFDIPDIPNGLLAKGGDFVAELYRELEAWYEYVLHLHTIAELKTKEWKNIVSVLSKKLIQNGLAKEDIDTDKAMIQARENLQKSEQESALWGVQVQSLDRRMKMVSRAVTILEQEMEKSWRSANVGAGLKYERSL